MFNVVCSERAESKEAFKIVRDGCLGFMATQTVEDSSRFGPRRKL